MLDEAQSGGAACPGIGPVPWPARPASGRLEKARIEKRREYLPSPIRCNVRRSMDNLQLFHLEKPATFFCTVRKVEVTSAKVAVNLQTGDLLSNGAYGQLLAGQ